MSVFFYYGSLADATITEGDVACDAQHPITNLNYLDKGLYAKFDDGGSEMATPSLVLDIDLAKIDMGSDENASSWAIDLSSFVFDYSVTNSANPTYSANFDNFHLQIYGSDDDATYTLVDTIYTEAISADTYTKTLDSIYAGTYTEASYRYYKLIARVDFGIPAEGETITWEIAGKINNLYIGDYLEMPSPELVNDELEHDVELMTSYGGKRVAVEKQEQRKIWNYDYLNLTDAEKTAQTAFDVVAGGGKIPVYFENVSGTTQKEDLTYCRVTNVASRQETASGNHSTSQIIEEEL